MKKFFKRFLPSQQDILNNKHLKIFGKVLHNPNLWHLNRHSVARAVSIGLFIGYLPFPGHTIFATFMAVFLSANLPISIAFVWVSNPFTIPPMFYFAYKVGTVALHSHPAPFQFHASLHWFLKEIDTVGPPLLVGSLICGTLLAILGNLVVQFYWRWSVRKAWRKRAQKRRA